MRRLIETLGLLGAMLGASCGGVPKTYYYTLRPPAAVPASDPKTNFTLAVEHFRAAEVLRDDRIVYYTSPTELGFYEYHRWSSNPATMLMERTARWLEQMGIFAHVRLVPTREPSDYTLKGRVLSFEEVDYEGGGKGRVALELVLVRMRDQRVVWSFSRQAERPREAGGVASVVEALNASSDELLSRALPELAAQVERELAQAQPHPE